jgi:hypothetical protein
MRQSPTKKKCLFGANKSSEQNKNLHKLLERKKPTETLQLSNRTASWSHDNNAKKIFSRDSALIQTR